MHQLSFEHLLGKKGVLMRNNEQMRSENTCTYYRKNQLEKRSVSIQRNKQMRSENNERNTTRTPIREKRCVN